MQINNNARLFGSIQKVMLVPAAAEIVRREVLEVEELSGRPCPAPQRNMRLTASKHGSISAGRDSRDHRR